MKKTFDSQLLTADSFISPLSAIHTPLSAVSPVSATHTEKWRVGGMTPIKITQFSADQSALADISADSKSRKEFHLST